MAEPLDRLRTALEDRYAIERELGQGGMATVYLAHDRKLGRAVALKVLRPELAAALGSDRFLREIEIAAKLTHPHILALHDCGEAGGLLYYTMPFVEGESLRDRLTREKQLPLDDALRIAREVADGLGYAHSRGLVHRDIKPENILFEAGHAVVSDFGIARAVSAAGTARLTETGLAIGTPAYMSPEQAAGSKDVDGRSDLYSLGCVLYEMLSGETPYTGATPQAILAKKLSEPLPRISVVREAVPAGIEAALTKVLARTPADRFTTAAQFADSLTAAVGVISPPGTAVIVPARRWRRPLFATLMLAVLLGSGALFAWWRAHGGSGAAGPKLLAVLPFENLGAPKDEYFADGVADEVRGKLLAVPGLEVIASGSADQYRHTTKSPAQIAQELGVHYLLVGKVRWEKRLGGASRVQVTTELVHVTAGPPTMIWQAPFDAALTDVFQVQTDIAGRVAQALDVALGDSTRQQLAEQPTQNLAAYDAFLRGQAASPGTGMFGGDPPSLRRAVAAYEQAVALDPTFVAAWAQLSRTHSALYYLSTPTPAERDAARQAAERASTIAPHRPDSHQALGDYYHLVLADNSRALAEDSTALVLAPGSADGLTSMAEAEYSLGRWDAARAHLEQAARLNPREALVANQLWFVFLCTRHYPEARQAIDRALALAPNNLQDLEARAELALAQGDLAGARAVLRAAPPAIDSTALVAFVANYWDLMWVLDDAQQTLLLRLGPSAFDNDRGVWGIIFAQTYALRGDPVRARVYADTARRAFEEQLRATPGDAQRRVLLGLALAYLGRTADAIREGERGAALLTIAQNAFQGAYDRHQLVRIYMLVGEPEKALGQLEPLLRVPYYLSPGWLRIDPNFAPLRGNARFQALLMKYGG